MSETSQHVIDARDTLTRVAADKSTAEEVRAAIKTLLADHRDLCDTLLCFEKLHNNAANDARAWEHAHEEEFNKAQDMRSHVQELKKRLTREIDMCTEYCHQRDAAIQRAMTAERRVTELKNALRAAQIAACPHLHVGSIADCQYCGLHKQFDALRKATNYVTQLLDAVFPNVRHAIYDTAEGIATVDALVKELEQSKIKEENAFYHGYACCASLVAAEHFAINPVTLFADNGVTWDDLIRHGCDNFDLKRIARGLGQSGLKAIGRKPRMKKE